MKSYEELVKENKQLKQQLNATTILLQKAQVQAPSGDKTLSLLKSIDQLKKELYKEKQLHKDNVRIKIIEKQKGELLDQEKIIDALRKVINNEDACDKAILAMLNEGPKRVRETTKEDLLIEIRKLRAMVSRPSSHKSSIAAPEEKNIEELLKCIEEKSSKIDALEFELNNTKLELTVKSQALEELQKQHAVLNLKKI